MDIFFVYYLQNFHSLTPVLGKDFHQTNLFYLELEEGVDGVGLSPCGRKCTSATSSIVAACSCVVFCLKFHFELLFCDNIMASDQMLFSTLSLNN